MLKRLRWQMVLLNACISGAILLMMALASLRVSENMLSSQYERDLKSNAAEMMMSIHTASEGVRIQFASGYMLYQETGDDVRVIGTQKIDSGDMERIAQYVRKEIPEIQGEVLVSNKTAKIALKDPEILQQRFFISASTVADVTSWINDDNHDDIHIQTDIGTENVAFVSKIQSFPVNTTMLVNAQDTSYRVMPLITISEQSSQLLMILQDRTEELKALTNLRWLFFSCVLGGLVLTVVASLYLSARSIRPVEQSIKRQREFVAAASHELRTPVAAVRANAEVLQDVELGEYAPYLQSIEQESHRMAHLVSDLMNLARADADEFSIQFGPVELAELVGHTLDAMRPLADKNGIEIAYSLQNVLVKGDAARLHQALMALLDNALRYTPKGGKVRLTVEKQGTYGLIRIIDNGPGIPDEHKARVFDRFYRVESARSNDGGCGLGLSVAHQLIGKMGGMITLSDAPDGGCLFEVRLKMLK